jgi:hypothetical protein
MDKGNPRFLNHNARILYHSLQLHSKVTQKLTPHGYPKLTDIYSYIHQYIPYPPPIPTPATCHQTNSPQPHMPVSPTLAHVSFLHRDLGIFVRHCRLWGERVHLLTTRRIDQMGQARRISQRMRLLVRMWGLQSARTGDQLSIGRCGVVGVEKRKSSGRRGSDLVEPRLLLAYFSGIPHDAMKDGEVRDMNGNLRRLVEYTTCANIENAVVKNGNLSKTRRNTCIPITAFILERNEGTYVY